MVIQIPGEEALDIRYVVFDYNGTLAEDGAIHPKTAQKLLHLSRECKLYILTANTNETAEKECRDLPVILKTFTNGTVARQKADLVRELGSQYCACLGNGRNDIEMFQAARLSVAVMDREGIYAPLLPHADLLVYDICDAVDLFLTPNRLVAGLRP